MIITVGELITDDGHYHGVWTPSSITLGAFLVVAVLVVGLFYNGPLKRQAAERSEHESE
jgi:hypothetical protein